MVRDDNPFLSKKDPRFEIERNRYCQLANKKEKPGVHGGVTISGQKEGSKNKVASGRRRRRGGRRHLCPELRDELFAFFVDTIENVKGRLDSVILMVQAEIIIRDILQFFNDLVAEGKADPADRPRVPKITFAWIHRWRLQYGITYRTVSLRVKCSWAKLYQRITLFWVNVLRLRWLHYFLRGEQQSLRFLNCDEKPLWYNYTADQKTMALKGVARVEVREILAKRKQRFTAKTITRWPRLKYPETKKIAILVKGKTDLVTRDVIQSEGVLLQYASHASYQEATNNQFYEWLLDEEAGTHRHKTAFGRTSENAFQILFLEITFFMTPPLSHTKDFLFRMSICLY